MMAGSPGSPNAAEAFLSKMPKAELHLHLGPLRPSVPSGPGGGLEVFAHGPGHRVVGAEVALAVG